MIKNFIAVLSLLSSVTVFAYDTCTVKDKRGFHPDGTPSAKVAVSCTDNEFQREILLRYESYRIGNSAIFQKEIKIEIIKDILSAGYQKVSYGMYIKSN